MKKASTIIMILLVHFSVFGLDERDVLVEKLINPATTVEGAQGLYENYQLGGVRTIIKQFNNMSPDLAMQYALAFRNLDLFRFRNDMNANLQEAKTVEHKGIALMLLSSLGRQIDANIFMEFAQNVNEDIKVRLAASACLCAIQNPKYFEMIAQIAEDSVVDYSTGQNDFKYCDFTNVSPGLFYYLKPKMADRYSATHGIKMVLLHTVHPNSTEFYEMMLNLRDKDYYSLMVNFAVKCGGVQLLDYMEGNKKAKKVWDLVKAAKASAALVASNKSEVFHNSKKEDYPLGAIFSRTMSGSGQDGMLSSVALVKVAADGTISVEKEVSPFGKSGAFNSLKGKKTLAAKLNFEPVDSEYVVFSPF